MAVFLTKNNGKLGEKKTMQPPLHHVCAALEELRLQKNKAYNLQRVESLK